MLLPLLLSKIRRRELAKLSLQQLAALGLLGIVYYALTQGALFLGLNYLPANMLSLVLSLSGITIALSGSLFLEEKLSTVQRTGVAVSIAGALIYFGSIQELSAVGLLVALFALISNTASATLGRAVNRSEEISPLLVTVVSMGIGAIGLLLAGLATEPFPALRMSDILIIMWLAAVNTAVAFTLWNHTLRTLTAAQSSVINNSDCVSGLDFLRRKTRRIADRWAACRGRGNDTGTSFAASSLGSIETI